MTRIQQILNLIPEFCGYPRKSAQIRFDPRSIAFDFCLLGSDFAGLGICGFVLFNCLVIGLYVLKKGN
jgi:hypothetical protein